MSRAIRFALPPILATLALCGVEIGRTLLFASVSHGGLGPALVLALCLLGVLGLPVLLVALAGRGLAAAVSAGWRWGRGSLGPPLPARRAAWVLYGALSLGVSVLAVQQAVVLFSQRMRQPVYQGLAAGLTGAVVLLVLLALAGPVVGLLARGLGAVSRRVPIVLDPTGGPGAAIWLGIAVLVGGLLAPLILPELHTLDLRPAWLVLFALAVYVGAELFAQRLHLRAPRAAVVLVAATLLATVVGLGTARSHLGGRQARLLALDRDTLLAGPLLRRLRGLADRDGDGVPATYGGGDCDDADPDVRPGGVDLPDDKVDQNCTGQDLQLRHDPLAPPPRPPLDASSGPAPYHVVFVTLDAVRDDLARRHMPNLQALAAESIDFRNAYAHGAATYWSIPALMAGTVPSRLEFGADQTPVEKEVLLAEVLRDAGWHTALYANVTIFFIRGLKQGTEYQNFATSDFTKHGEFPGAQHLTQGLLAYVDKWLGGSASRLGGKDRLFLWGHYYDPHDPYGDVPGHPARDGSDLARYEANLAYTDEHLGALVAGLKSRGLWEKTVFVVTADHGDEFFEHGHRFHGATLYEEMSHVPLVVRVPGLSPRALDTPIGHMDVGPTLLDLLRVKVPGKWSGRSRWTEMRTGEPVAPYPVYLEVLSDGNYGSHQVGLVLGRKKLIQRLNEGYLEMYDLDRDPSERDNAVDDDPDAAALRETLGVYADHHLHWVGQGKTGARVPPRPRGRPAKR